MAYDITIRGNYLFIDNNGGDLFDRPISEVFLAKKSLSDDKYTLYHNNVSQKGYENILWSDFTLDGQAFSSLSDFENWKNKTLSGVGNGAPVPDGTFTVFEAVSDGSIPAGKVSVTMLFRGKNGTLNGMAVPNNYSISIEFPSGHPLPEINYTVPSTGDKAIKITILQ